MLTCSMMRFLSLLLLGLCDACTVVCVACVCAVRVRVWGPEEVWLL